MKELPSIHLPLYSFFDRLRKDSQLLGMQDYFLWIEAMEGGFGLESVSSLKRLCKAIWYKPGMDISFFEGQLEEALNLESSLAKRHSREALQEEPSIVEKPTGSKDAENLQTSKDPIDSNVLSSDQAPPKEEEPDQAKEEPNDEEFIVSIQSVSEKQKTLEVEKNRGVLGYSFDFSSRFLPLAERKVSLSFRFLRDMVLIEESDELDIDATLEKFYQTGFVSELVVKKQFKNQFVLSILLDYGGSMEPFHTLMNELLDAIIGSGVQIKLYYFFNTIEDGVFTEKAMLNLIKEEEFFEIVRQTSSLLIVSDAGAARGSNNPAKVKDTLRSVRKLKKKNNRIVWLNFVPKDRWKETSAELISEAVRMFDLEENRIDTMVNILLGKEYVYKS